MATTTVDLSSYRFVGRPMTSEAVTLEEALADLADRWTSHPSLVNKDWGIVDVRVEVGGELIEFQIADPAVLDAVIDGDYGPLYSALSSAMGVDEAQARELLDATDQVEVMVSTIRPPRLPAAWQPEPGLSAEDVLPEATVGWAATVAAQKATTDPSEARQLQLVAIERGVDEGLSDAQISRLTGRPRSTVRDARMRYQRKAPESAFAERKPGERFTEAQLAIIEQRLEQQDGNAAAAARQLGLSARSVRSVRERISRKQHVSKGSREQQRNELTRLMQTDNITATEAGRRLGIAGRTARRWAASKKGDES